jgi:hypothetical protein
MWLPKTSSALLGLCFEDPASSQRNSGERLRRLPPHPVGHQSDHSWGHFLHLQSFRPSGTMTTEDMGVPVLTGADGRLAITEASGQKAVERRVRLHNVSKTGDDSGRLQTTQEGNKLYTRQRVISQLGTKVVRHQPVTKTSLIGFESRWGRPSTRSLRSLAQGRPFSYCWIRSGGSCVPEASRRP